MNAAWWTQQEAGLIFGLAGGFVGVLGGLLGVWLGLLARRGIGQPVALALHSLGGLIGVSGLALAGAALVDGQPWHVWVPSLNLGLLCTGLFVGLYFSATRRVYAQARQRMLENELIGSQAR